MNNKHLPKSRSRFRLIFVLGLLMSTLSYHTKAQCIGSFNNPTGTISISPYVQTMISTNMFPGAYAIINITTPGEYGIAASFGSFFTVTDNSNNPLGSGPNTLYFNFPSAGLYRIHLHATAGCGTGGGSRIVAVAPRNRAFHFDGANDYINLGNSINSVLDPINKFTAEAWVLPSSTVSPTFDAIVGNYNTSGGGMQFLLRQTGNKYEFWIDGGSGFVSAGSAVGTVSVGVWQHVAGTWDGSVIKLYINGVLSATNNAVGASFTTNSNQVWIGGQSINSEYFEGRIDEVRLWTRSLCQGEILNNKSGAIPTSAAGLLANYHFNQGVAGGTNTSVTSLIDDSGNSYNGTVLNAALTGTISNWMSSAAFGDGAAAPAFTSPTVAITGANTLCSGNSLTLTANGNVSTYQWVSGPATATNVVSPGTTTTYSVTGTNSVGCVSNVVTHTVTVNTTPTVSVNSGSICSGNSFTISPSGASTYTIQGGTAVVSPVASTSYTVIGSSAAGCVSANTATSSVTVNTTPTVSVNSGSICSGNPFVITPSGASSYTVQGGTFTVSPTVNTSYTVIGSSSGCTSANTATSNVTLGTCALAEALNSDGSNDYVSIPKSISSDFTIEYWMKTTQTGQTGPQWYFGNGLVDAEVGGVTNDFGTALVGSKVGFGIGNPDITIFSTSNVNTGNWTHVAATWEQSTGAMKLYVNGVLESTGTSGTALRTAPPDIKIGVLGTLLRYLNVEIDEVRLWNAVRTSCEINTYKNCEIPTSATGLVANYHFNQGYAANPNPAVTSLTDVSGNSNNGTLINFALNGSTSNWVAPGGVVTGSTTPLPPPVVGSAVTNSIICLGNSTTLSGTGVVTYTWTGGISDGVAFSPTATASYTVTGTAANGCTNTAVDFVTVNALPTISVNSGAICAGGSFTMMPTGASTYTFSGGSAVVSPTANASYTVDGTDANGCVNAVSAVSNVTVNALPTISVNSGAICAGGSFTLMPNGASTYTFSGGSAVVSPTANASYTVDGTDANGCTNSISAISSVTVNSLPTINATTSSSIICTLPTQQTATLSATGATTYTWSNSANGSSTAVSPSITTTYTVIGTDVNGCENMAMITQSVATCAGVNETSAEAAVSVYPNPNNGLFTLELQNSSSHTEVLIMNVLGEIVLSETVSQEKTHINIETLKDGIYFIYVLQNNSRQVIKLVKE